ncbi:TPA: phage portal protein [Staphylococcus aureus]|uniref:Phage portal protein n=8 Tax=Staphylococcus aureus TaxID=1280 RepID=A0A0U1MUR7_STAAU|nr:phage portal protein [Staphylococcus aureus]EHO92703.1 phage portal protein, HK97 family [Staphylococcus aureus subsp. aureus 21252]EHT67735.1 phage portal protein, HK97 family [Staphylococcus aureus subsp. aureus CIG290]EVY96421.1 HK97 family phage portal protein [Staphylococcus aureus W56227]EVY98953.1 HK97 family phage portal protein [Staphylococcus aureus W56243]EVZ01718.1 HK97 family phage portal protein [Staphylococcus aureus W56246]
MGLLSDLFKSNRKTAEQLGLSIVSASKKTHIKRLAINSCIELIAKTVSQVEFKIKDNNKYTKDSMYYKLNVKPNINESATQFWQKAIYKLLYDNELLIIQNDSEDLLVADSYHVTEYAHVPNIYSQVRIGDFEYTRTFNSNDVIHIKYNNENSESILNELYGDYGDLFARFIEFQMRKSQVRSIVKIDSKWGNDKERRAKVNKFIQDIYQNFKDKSFAIVPEQEGIQYKEQTLSQAANSVDDVDKVGKQFLNNCAIKFGIPVQLLTGDIAEVDQNMKRFIKMTIKPLLQLIVTELNAKLFDEKQYLNDSKIIANTLPITFDSIFDMANQIDKLVASSVFVGNEIRRELGYEESKDELMNEHLVTKNYQTLKQLREGVS